MIQRAIETAVNDSLRRFPVVGLIGSRQAGKTTLAKVIAEQGRDQTVYLDLERPSDWEKLDEAELYLERLADRLVILDEVQRKPELFPLLRALVDADNRPGRFLILGSASPAMKRQSAESLAGRICYHELTPLLWRELQPEQVKGTRQEMETLWRRGGYPRSLLADTEAASFAWREAFIQTHLERDLPQLGIRVPAAALHRFWLMLAHAHGQLWHASRIASNLGVSARTVRHYLDILQDTFMVRSLPPWFRNVKKRLVKASKVYLRDSGLLHVLLKIDSQDSLMGHPSVGASWEGWVMEQIMAMIPRSWVCSFFRTAAGAEIDLVIEPMAGTAPIAVEIKFSASPKPSKGFWSALADLKSQRAFVVYPGNEYYPLGQNAFALPARELHRILATGP
jgi:uncharacterized protein